MYTYVGTVILLLNDILIVMAFIMPLKDVTLVH